MFPALGSRPNLLCLHSRFDDGRQPRHSLAHASSCRAARFPTARSPLEEFPSPTAVPTSPWDLALPRLPLRHSRLATRHPLPDDGIAPFLTSQPPTGPCSIDESVVPPTVAGERAPVPSWASGLSSHQVPGASRERDAPCPPDAPQAEPLRAEPETRSGCGGSTSGCCEACCTSRHIQEQAPFCASMSNPDAERTVNRRPAASPRRDSTRHAWQMGSPARED